MLADELEIFPAGSGSRIRLRVKPKAKRDALEGTHGGALKISVKAPPDRGSANRAVEAILAEALGLARSAVLVISGLSSRNKVVEIHPLPPDEVRRRLSGDTR